MPSRKFSPLKTPRFALPGNLYFFTKKLYVVIKKIIVRQKVRVKILTSNAKKMARIIKHIAISEANSILIFPDGSGRSGYSFLSFSISTISFRITPAVYKKKVIELRKAR